MRSWAPGSLLFEKLAIRVDVCRKVCFGGLVILSEYMRLFSSSSGLSKSNNFPVKSVVEMPVVRLTSLKRLILLRISLTLTPSHMTGSSPWTKYWQLSWSRRSVVHSYGVSGTTMSPHLIALTISARSYPFMIVGPLYRRISSSELGPISSVLTVLAACLIALKWPEWQRSKQPSKYPRSDFTSLGYFELPSTLAMSAAKLSVASLSSSAVKLCTCASSARYKGSWFPACCIQLTHDKFIRSNDLPLKSF